MRSACHCFYIQPKTKITADVNVHGFQVRCNVWTNPGPHLPPLFQLLMPTHANDSNYYKDTTDHIFRRKPRNTKTTTNTHNRITYTENTHMNTHMVRHFSCRCNSLKTNDLNEQSKTPLFKTKSQLTVLFCRKKHVFFTSQISCYISCRRSHIINKFWFHQNRKTIANLMLFCLSDIIPAN